MRSKLLFLFLFFKKQDFKASLEQSIMLLRDNMNRLIILNEQHYSYSSHYSIAKNDVGEKGAGREKTRVGSSQREKAGEIEGGMQPKNTMFNVSK